MQKIEHSITGTGMSTCTLYKYTCTLYNNIVNKVKVLITIKQNIVQPSDAEY